MGRLWNNIKGSIGNSKNVLTIEQVKDVQKILLMILKDVDRVCRSNNLRYALIGGSAIGSLRHEGFIPWDDDVDIAMPRKDYETFSEIIKREFAEKYKLTDSLRKSNYGKVISKLRLNGTRYTTVLDVEPDDSQMKIDIYVIENVYDNSLLRWIQGIICTFFGFSLSCRRMYESKDIFSSYYKGRDFKFKVLIGRIFSFASLNQWAYWTERCYSMCKNDNSKYVTVPSDGLHFFKGIIKREVICDVIDGSFEGCKFYLPKEYDFYLKRIYGNYMEMPREEKRLLAFYKEISFGKYDDYVSDGQKTGSI